MESGTLTIVMGQNLKFYRQAVVLLANGTVIGLFGCVVSALIAQKEDVRHDGINYIF